MSEPKEVSQEIPMNHGDHEPTSLNIALDFGDVELIRTALSLSLEERLAVLQDFVDTFWTPQHG